MAAASVEKRRSTRSRASIDSNDLDAIPNGDPLAIITSLAAVSDLHTTDKHDFAPDSGPSTQRQAPSENANDHPSSHKETITPQSPTNYTFQRIKQEALSSPRPSADRPRRIVSFPASFPSPNGAIPDGYGFYRHSTIGTTFSESFEQSRPWDRKAILSLDGGGIRGYSALLILQALMREIGKLERGIPPGERECDGPATSSCHPVNSDLIIMTSGEPSHLRHLDHESDTASWLPCHYFDYMAGTSTGGLIGIMLGRLRMTVDDCIKEYETLGAEVFAHARWFHLKSILWQPREKYDHRRLERVIRGLVNRKVPRLGTFPGGKTFAFDENRCRVVVTSYQQSMEGENDHAELTYLFRTYKNLHQPATTDDKLIYRNPGPAHDIPIWQVARATSAAPGYFKEVEIEERLYLDGGFGANNPSVEIYEEVRRMNNQSNQCIGALVSIGTGKNKEQRFRSAKGLRAHLMAGLVKFLNFDKFARKLASDSEAVHGQMLRNPNKEFKYHRFNVEEGLDQVQLDDWRARGAFRLRIGRCIGQMRGKKRACRENPTAADRASSPDEKRAAHVDRSEKSRSPDSQSPLTGREEHHPDRIPKWFQPRNKTLEALRTHTEAYLATDEMQKAIKECAQLLVDGRRERARADPQRWERACFGAWYQCIHEHCPRGEKEYHTRDDIERHFLHKHHTVYSKRDAKACARLDATLDKCKVVVH